MKYSFSVLFVFLFLASAFSQQNRRDYIKKYQLLAIDEMKRSGVPASITMAQACLESGDGNSELSLKSNNHFGIKCKSNWRGKKVYYDDDRKNECFRKYNNVEDSYIDHSNFLMENGRYSSLFQLAPDDYKGWARGLKKAGYATANHYDKSLIKIIEDFQLYRLDYKITHEELEIYEQIKIGNEGISNTLTINLYQSHKVFNINSLKSIVAKEGDTYDIIAQEFGLKNWEISKFNDLPLGYIPQPNEVVYIQNKKRRSAKNHLEHRVNADETMHYISQLYGIKLKPLYRRNQMKYGEKPASGQIIQLRKRIKNN